MCSRLPGGCKRPLLLHYWLIRGDRASVGTSKRLRYTCAMMTNPLPLLAAQGANLPAIQLLGRSSANHGYATERHAFVLAGSTIPLKRARAASMIQALLFYLNRLLFCAGISRDSLHKRRLTGGKQAKWRKKRK